GRFYATSTACVIPSIWSENSPLVAYECLAAGLPMVASRIGGIPELVEEGIAGWTFDPRDSADLAAKCVHVLRASSEERDRMSQAMRRSAERFTARPHVDQLEELYGKAAAAPRLERSRAGTLDVELLTVIAKLADEKGRLARVCGDQTGHIR